MSQLLLWFLLVFCTDPQSTSICSNPILGTKTAKIDRRRVKIPRASIFHCICSSISRTPYSLFVSWYFIEAYKSTNSLGDSHHWKYQSSADTLRNASKEVDTATQPIRASRTFRQD